MSDDKGLDAALSALSNVTTDEDDRWARRVASKLSTFAPVTRREVDPLLAAPFPDDFVDDETLELTDASGGHGAAFAADGVGAGGWEGSMSDEVPRSASGGLTGLAGLTRSGPPSSVRSDRGLALGAAEGEDSGLIDLRAVNAQAEVANDVPVSEPAESPPASSRPEAGAPLSGPAAISAPTSVKSGPSSARSGPTSVKSGPAVNERPIAVAPPSGLPASALNPASSVAASSTSAAANSVPASTTGEKKKGAGLWIAFGGLAAAAAVAFAVLPSMTKRDEPAATAAAPKAEGDKKTETPSPVASAAPTVAASASANAAVPEPAVTVAAGGTAAKAAPPGAAPLAGGKKTGPEAAPTAAPAPSAAATSTSNPITKPAGGSLDDVLGIGKDQPIEKKAPTDNLPDKPDAMDVRSAVNSKLSAAHACVKGLEGPSSVSVTFGPAGNVSAVSVTSGPAKGTGAESCIKGAFSNAKVPPSKKGASGSAVVQP